MNWAANERSHRVTREIDGQTERSNGAFGESDIEGKVARVAARRSGDADRVSNAREHMSQFQPARGDCGVRQAGE